MSVPDFSPAMLRLMLEARAVLAADDSGLSTKKYARQLAKAAGVHVRAVHFALAGRLWKAEPRAKIWACLGHQPPPEALTPRGGRG